MSHPSRSVIAAIADVIGARFEEQVAANWDRPAVSAQDVTLSYEALNARANRIARAIGAASSGSAVGVVMSHGAAIIAAMLGVMKAGRIFVPLDPRQPPARHRQILDDCRASVLVTDSQKLPHARALRQPGVEIIDLDAIDDILDIRDPEHPVDADSLACLIYTSGSTGAPKGVMQTHRSLIHRTKALTELVHVKSTDRLAMLATCAVSQGLTTALQALLNGGSVHPFDLKERGIGDLASWLIDQRITVLVCSPSTFRHFAGTLTSRDEFPDLKAIRVGSEPVLPRDFEMYRRHFSRRCVFIGTLGATETGPIAAHVMDHDSEIGDAVPAGYPVGDTHVRILDDDNHECPVGESGEIVVRNSALFSGYWQDPDRTAASLVWLPGAYGGHFYRTGDLGRRRADGRLDYVGRKNLRVKIRGFRIELEEIERALSSHPSVSEAAALVQPDTRGDQMLVACVVSSVEPPPAVDGLRSHLRQTLPEQMVPSAFHYLPALPRTANGKICRASLASLPGSPPPAVADHRPPSDIAEMCLARLWEELLDHRPIGVTADFFELGGHSLLAARLIASIERTFGIKLPLSAFVEAATIERQARLIRRHTRDTPWPSLVPIRTAGSKPPLFCMHMREGDVLSYRDLVRHLPSDQPVYGLQSRGLDGISPINTTLEAMARDYVAEIRTFHPHGPYALCGWSFGGVLAFEVARQLEQEGSPVALVAMFDSVAPGMRRSQHLLRREITRAPAHVSALVHKGARVAYLRKRLRTAKRLVEAPLWRMLVRWHRRGGWLPRALRNVYRANRVALRDYVPREYGGRITLFKVARRSPHDPHLGWQGLAAGGLTVHEVPGTHVNMVFEPHARTLAEMLSSALGDAWANHGA